MNQTPLILLAEDHPVNQKVALLLLSRFGFQVQAVANGRQAVEAVKTGRYDLILMDVMMPDMDGLDATRLIREWEKTNGHRTPIIALTALAMVGDRERCLAAGMDDYITKPIDPPLLKSKINSWLRERELDGSPIAETALELIDLAELQVSYGNCDMQEILDLFVNVTSTLLDQLQVTINDQDFQCVEHLAHELKGSSAAIYARPLATLCMQLEDAARKKDADTICGLLPPIKQTFLNLKQVIEQAHHHPD